MSTPTPARNAPNAPTTRPPRGNVIAPARRIRDALAGIWRRLGPPALAALLAALCGVLEARPQLEPLLRSMRGLERHGASAIVRLADLAAYPQMLIGLGLVLMSVGLALRARVAWVIALVLGLQVAGAAAWFGGASSPALWSALLLVAALTLLARHFNRSNLAASSLFALLGIGSLLVYGILGSLWFGAGYAPPIHDLGTAFYYAIETMSTVGYGDIVPRSPAARMFTVSMIVLGITVFATTLSVVIGPLVGGTIKRTLEGRMQKKHRRNHFVIIGTSSLAYTLWQELHTRGVAVTVIAPPGNLSPYPADADVITGDATRAETLEEAAVAHARAVLTLRDDDAENAFAVLAVKEIAPTVKTIAGVNDARHLAKIRRVQPDMLFAPQVLGSELLVRTLFDEPIDKDTVSRLLFAQD
ncbi:MAG: voltage-gated potassium channel protein [Gammaproteobacteria bacterium]|nr:voltage-gated potassium channel protein [Gammaproteobacteria bacterium]